MIRKTFLILLLSYSTCVFAQDYSLNDFYKYDPEVEYRIDTIFSQMSDTAIAGQMIVQATGRLGKPKSDIENLIKAGTLGGVLLLNGEKEQFKSWVDEFNNLNQGIPLIYSADAEPSLVNRKIKGSAVVPKTNELITREEVISAAQTINKDLSYIGINYNYAPVVDLSPNNSAIRNRSIGSDPESVVNLSDAFIQATQDSGIVATAKHFPGHGLVSGDTHEQLVTIDGTMEELAVYDTLISRGVISIMVAHIAVINNEEYNTGNLPASCSRTLITDLLKKKMGFKGLVVTDALNMGALNRIDNAPFLSVKAGSDMVLMPVDEGKFMEATLNEMNADPEFRSQVYISVRKILRLKLLLGLFDQE